MLEHSETTDTRYRLNNDGEFIISDYNSTKPFSSFFPGIAGPDGIPMWVFYVNRGQGICSMGVQDKDHPIMEFQPANRAYDSVTRDGFRTFLKLPDNPVCDFYEPFQNQLQDRGLQRSQRMTISPAGLTVQEFNQSLNLECTVEYFCVPQDDYAGLIRTLTIKNTGADELRIEGLDGLPVIVPYGVDNFCLKNMRRTIEAFVEVCNLDKGVPFFKGRVEPADRPDVLRITRGNFYLGFEVDGSHATWVTPIVDPTMIFGARTDHSFPERFLDHPAAELLDNQILESQLPCAMGSFNAAIPAGGQYTYCSIIGHASSQEELNELAARIASPSYVRTGADVNRRLIDTLTQHNFLCSGEPALDQYARQNFLDNAMRGGFPFTFRGGKKRSTLYLYSRKHGDLERDYNDFRLMPTNYSQGNGNFRDINQNRRSDLLINPDIGEENVEYFYNLIQLDGYNPLVVKEIRFAVDDRDQAVAVLKMHLGGDQARPVAEHIEEPFTPGTLLAFLKEQEIPRPTDSEVFLGELLDACRRIPDTDHGEGFWTDHWTYNLDLLENFQAVYPDRLSELLFGDRRFTFYNNAHRVQPRNRKYMLWNGRPMQLEAVVYDEDKAAVMEVHEYDQHLVRTDFGRGEVYRTSLFVKMLCLLANKMASLDPEGVGVELEAGKPNWYDALNGLPGLMGSSINETLEIKRHLCFMRDHLEAYRVAHDSITVFAELADFITALQRLLRDDLPAFEYWDSASSAKECFREQTRLGVSGNETRLSLEELNEFITAALKKLDAAVEKARDPNSGALFTYFRHEVTDFEEVPVSNNNSGKKSNGKDNGSVPIRPLKFKQVPLPLFLEGIVHYLRCKPETSRARDMAACVRKSDLYDKTLKMYKVNAPLGDQPMEIGRARVFSPGWLENESVWLHMEYKYLLELLRNGLYEEFYRDFRTVCIPFLNPETYGRSILENSSFIVSSANPDPSKHGNGFVARLSGATAEFIHMLSLMTIGPRPFRLGPDGELQLRFEPALPASLFTQEARTVSMWDGGKSRELSLPAQTFSFMFLGTIPVTYYNPDMKDTFGQEAVSPVQWTVTGLDGDVMTFDSREVSGHIVRRIRAREIQRIEVQLR